MYRKPFISFYDHALKLLSNRPHAEKELRQKLEILSKKRFSRTQYYKKLNSLRNSPFSVFENEATEEDNEKEIEEAITRLKREGFINDKSFAEWYCTQRQEFNQRSRKLLMLELQMKGVDRSIIQEAVKQYHNEDACCLLVAQRKLSVMEKEKLISYLLRKGFEMDTIKRVLSQK